jgi:hypothetical protein
VAERVAMSGRPCLAPGLFLAHDGIDVRGREPWLIDLRGKASFDLVPEIEATGGHRPPSSQARVMLDYVRDFGATLATRTPLGKAKGKDLTRLYGRAATELLALPRRDVETWTPKVAELYRRGLLDKHGHTADPTEAIDFELGDAAHNAELIRAALANGARAAYNDGPCIHVALPVAQPDDSELNAWREVQANLKRAGYDPGPVDGIPGPQTRAAIMDADPAATPAHLKSGVALLAWARSLPAKSP